MESQLNENSPPRSGLVMKTRRQSVLDSPSRVTRSQSRRLSSAPVEMPMSLKTAATRRRSTRVSLSQSDIASLDDASSVQDEGEAIMPMPRSRKSTRTSISSNDGPGITSRSRLSSIIEVSKPATRRTRASVKPSSDTESELDLPKSQSYTMSSASCVSTTASTKRRARVQTTSSHVLSSSFSEVPSKIRKSTPSPREVGDLNSSLKGAITPESINVSPDVQSWSNISGSKSPSKKSPSKEITPKSKKGSTKRSSLDNSAPDDAEHKVDLEQQKSQGRTSLSSQKSSPKFVETPLKHSPEENKRRRSASLNIAEQLSAETNSEGQEKPQRKSGGRLSWSEGGPLRRNSGRLSLSKSPVVQQAGNDSDKRRRSSSLNMDQLSAEGITEEQEKPQRQSPGRFSLSEEGGRLRRNSGRLSLSKSPVAQQPGKDSTGRLSLSSKKSPEPLGNLSGRFSVTIIRSPELEKSVRDSTMRLSLSSNKSPGLEKSFGDTSGRFSVSLIEQRKSKRDSVGSVTSGKSPEPMKPQLSFATRFSITPSKHDNAVESSQELSTFRSFGGSPVKSPSAKNSAVNSVFSPPVCLTTDSGRKSIGKLSLSPTKSSPGFSLNLDETSVSDLNGSHPNEQASTSHSDCGDRTDNSKLDHSFKGLSNVCVTDLISRRVSTGNIPPIKSCEFDSKFKSRSSMGPLLNKGPLISESFDKEEICDAGESSSSEEVQETQSSPSKSPKPSVSGHPDYHEVTMIEDIKSGLFIPGLPKTEHSEDVASGDSSNDVQPTTLLSSRDRNSHVSNKVLKDAAYLLSGGNVSDFDESNSDENQWQLVFSPPTKSKKEMRMEKKAKKKAEKEAKRVARAEKMTQFNHPEKAVASKNVDDSQPELTQSPSTESSQVESSQSHILSGGDSTSHNTSDTQNSKNVEESGGTDFKKSSKKQQDLQLHDCVSPKEEDAESESVQNKDQDVNNEVSTEKPAKKMKKKKKAKKEPLNGEDDTSVALDLPDDSNSNVQKIEKIKKVKKIHLESGFVTKEKGVESDGFKEQNRAKKHAISESEDLSVPIKKKKKLRIKDSELLSAERNAGSENAIEDVSSLVKKKKKKVKKSSDCQLVTDGNLSAPDGISSDGLVTVKKKKKKSKKTAGNETLSGEQTVNFDDNEVTKKKSKKLKLILDVENNVSSANFKDPSVKKKKAKKNKSEDLNQISEMDNGMSSMMRMEADNGSDSDDAPTSVSFAAGKQAALAEFQAAVESIKKQKELRCQKLKMKQERVKEEKLAKIKRLKEKHKHKTIEADEIVPQGVPEKSKSKTNLELDSGFLNPIRKLPKRLPTEVLESLSEQPSSKLIKRSDGTQERIASSALSEEKQERLKRKKAKKLALKLEKQKLRESEFLPLGAASGATRFGVVPLRNIMLAKKLEQNKLAEEASNLRNQTLFGNRHRRTPFSSLLAYHEKLQASGKDRHVNSK